MKLEELDVSASIYKYVNELNTGTLKSLAKNGLVSLSANNNITNGRIFGADDQSPELSVNYINLTGKHDIDRVLSTALWEEYTGVFGVSLERVFPFIWHNNSAELTKQINARLKNSILFVLTPPKTNISAAGFSVPSNVSSTGYSCPKLVYTLDDGAAQAQGALLSGADIKSPEVFEIKTNKSFNLKKDVIAAFVPSDIFELAEQCFQNIKIKLIKVDYKDAVIKKHPQIIEKLFKQYLDAPITVKIPDYEKALREHITTVYKQFSLHVVRLTNEFDINMRFVADCSKSIDVLRKNLLKTVHKNSDNSGWAMFSYGRHIIPIDKNTVVKLFNSNEICKPILNPDIAKLPGNFSMFKMPINSDIRSKNFELGVESLGIHVIKIHDYIMISAPQQLSLDNNNLLQHILATGLLLNEQKATSTIQTWWRATKNFTKKGVDSASTEATAVTNSAASTEATVVTRKRLKF